MSETRAKKGKKAAPGVVGRRRAMKMLAETNLGITRDWSGAFIYGHAPRGGVYCWIKGPYSIRLSRNGTWRMEVDE